MSPDEGWTRVHRKSRRNPPPPSPKTPAAADTFAPRTSGVLRPPEALRADYDKLRAQWLDSPAHEDLVRLVDERGEGLRVRRAVCLGIGTFDPEDGAWEAKRAAYVQLCALTTLTQQIEKYSKRSIECIFQEPIFTNSDNKFLTGLGHRIVDSPAAYDLIDDTTLLFAVHLYRPVYAAALKSNLPAVFVGTGWDVWDTVTMDKSTDLDNMKKMDKTYTRHAFPQDAASTAFSSTSIYFAPKGATPDVLPEPVETDKGGVVGEGASNKDAVAQEKDASGVSTSKKTDTATDEDTSKGKESEKRSVDRV